MLDATRTIIQAAVNADRTMPDGERRAVLAVCRKGYDWRKPQGGADCSAPSRCAAFRESPSKAFPRLSRANETQPQATRRLK